MRVLLTIFLLLATPVAGWAAGIKAEFLSASDTVLANPHDLDLSADGKFLYVSDLGNDRIAVFEADTLKYRGSIGDADGLAAPHDAHLGPDGLLYVADTGNDRIVVYAVNGLQGRKTGEITGPFAAPEGVHAGRNGRIFVTGAGSGNVVALSGGKVVARAEGLSAPHDVIENPDGSIWVADSGNDRMLLMTSELKLIKALEGAPYNFRGCRYQDLTETGALVVADKNSHSIKVIAPDGALLGVIGDGNRGNGPNVFATPEGVVIRGDTAWFSDSGNDRIVAYRLRVE